MWWAIGMYFFIGLLAAIGGYDRRNYDRRFEFWVTIPLWPLAVGK